MEDGSTPARGAARRLLGEGSLGAAWSPAAAPAATPRELRPGVRLDAGAATGLYSAAAPSPLAPPHKLLDLPAAPFPAGSGSPFAIRAYTGALGAAGASATTDTPSKEATVAEALQADYRAQLRQYQAQLAAREGDVAALRAQLAEVRVQLGAAEAELRETAEQAQRSTTQAAQLEGHVLTLEASLRQREQESAAAAKAHAEAEQAAAAARAQAAAAQRAAAAKCSDWEESRRYYKEQLDQRDAQLKHLEELVQSQAAEAERRARERAQREVDLSLSHAQSRDSAAELRSQLSVAQDKAEQAARRTRAAEATAAELRRQKAQMLSDMKTLEDLLAESDGERRELHEKYVVLGERMEVLVREEAAVREAAAAETEAARLAVQEAVRDAEAAVSERGGLQKRIKELQEALEAEQGARGKLADKVQRKLAAAEQEVGFLKAELESKVRQLKGLQGDMKAMQADADAKLDACESQMAALKGRLVQLSRELEQEKKRTGQVKEEADALWQERLKLEQQQVALKYERRIQELEVQYVQGVGLPRSLSCPVGAAASAAAAPTGATILDYIPRSEHVRVLESRLAAKESDMAVEMNSRVSQTEREWQWKVESKEQEISGLTNRLRQLEDDLHSERQRSASHAHKLSDENKRLQAQCVEAQRDLDAASKELARLKESLKDARLANAGMDDDQLAAGRQVARLKHALEEAHATLREAQAALDKERKRGEAGEREVQQAQARLEDAYRKAARLEGEAAELQAALAQKGEALAALQAENAGWSAKLSAQRERHDQEAEALRRQLRQEAEEKLGPLEQQCASLGAEVRELKQRHEQQLGELEAQHAAQVAQLEKQLAAAERCTLELKELSASLTGVRQEDVELLKGHIQDLQLRLKESHQQRGRERREHQAALGSLEAQLRTRLAELKGQHKALRAQVQGDVAQACSDCLRDFEAGLAALRQQLADSSAAAAQAQEAADAHIACLKGRITKLLAVVSEQCDSLPAGLGAALLDATGNGNEEGASRTLQLVAEALQQHIQTAASAAAEAVLGPLEECLLPEDEEAGGNEEECLRASPLRGRFAQGRPQSGRLGSPSLPRSPRKQQGQQSPGRRTPQARRLEVPELGAGYLHEGAEQRLLLLASRCRELLADLAANEEQIRLLQAKVASYDTAFAKAKAEGLQAAERAHEAAVAPLRQEVQRLQDRVRELQQQYTGEVAGIEASARQQLSEAQSQAQRAIDQATAQSRQLQSELLTVRERGDGAATELARTQEELASHTQRAASKIELQERELALLKERIREMERREAQSSEELRQLRQRAAQHGGSLGGSHG